MENLEIFEHDICVENGKQKYLTIFNEGMLSWKCRSIKMDINKKVVSYNGKYILCKLLGFITTILIHSFGHKNVNGKSWDFITCNMYGKW